MRELYRFLETDFGYTTTMDEKNRIADRPLTANNTMFKDLQMVKELVYDKCGFALTDLKQHAESADYGACSFKLNGRTIQYRVSKITPTKAGQFVTTWKRNKDGITQPFDSSDGIDFIIITSKTGNNFGQFIFPLSVLANKGIISSIGSPGKRGIRVYPAWDIPTNKQAVTTQQWQAKYFLTIKADNSTDLDLARKLFSQTSE